MKKLQISNQSLEKVWRMLLAIAYFEGFWQPGSRALRNNNPGNLRGWSKALPKDNKGFDIFPDLHAGTEALWRQIWKNIYRDLTLREFFDGKPLIYPGYAPRADNNPAEYSEFVSQVTKIPLDNITIREFLRV